MSIQKDIGMVLGSKEHMKKDHPNEKKGVQKVSPEGIK